MGNNELLDNTKCVLPKAEHYSGAVVLEVWKITYWFLLLEQARVTGLVNDLHTTQISRILKLGSVVSKSTEALALHFELSMTIVSGKRPPGFLKQLPRCCMTSGCPLS